MSLPYELNKLFLIKNISQLSSFKITGKWSNNKNDIHKNNGISGVLNISYGKGILTLNDTTNSGLRSLQHLNKSILYGYGGLIYHKYTNIGIPIHIILYKLIPLSPITFTNIYRAGRDYTFTCRPKIIEFKKNFKQITKINNISIYLTNFSNYISNLLFFYKHGLGRPNYFNNLVPNNKINNGINSFEINNNKFTLCQSYEPTCFNNINKDIVGYKVGYYIKISPIKNKNYDPKNYIKLVHIINEWFSLLNNTPEYDYKILVYNTKNNNDAISNILTYKDLTKIKDDNRISIKNPLDEQCFPDKDDRRIQIGVKCIKDTFKSLKYWIERYHTLYPIFTNTKLNDVGDLYQQLRSIFLSIDSIYEHVLYKKYKTITSKNKRSEINNINLKLHNLINNKNKHVLYQFAKTIFGINNIKQLPYYIRKNYELRKKRKGLIHVKRVFTNMNKYPESKYILEHISSVTNISIKKLPKYLYDLRNKLSHDPTEITTIKKIKELQLLPYLKLLINTWLLYFIDINNNDINTLISKDKYLLKRKSHIKG